MSRATTLIALSGFAGAGKDTAAAVLIQHAGFHKIAFADALRSEVAHGFGVSRDLLEDPKAKNEPDASLALTHAPAEFLGALVRAGLTDLAMTWPRSPRQILQLWGTQYRRGLRSDYWVTRLDEELRLRERWGTHRFVITDCRFPDEAAYARRRGGQLWQLIRPGLDAASTPEGQHQSATDGSGFGPELTLHNSGTPHDLRNTVLSAWWSHEAGVPVHAVVMERLAA